MNRQFIIEKQPKIFDALLAGLRTTTHHIYLILLPILLDLFFLISPRFTIYKLAKQALNQVILPTNIPENLATTWSEFNEIINEFFKYFSVSSLLRTIPIGLPSLFAGRILKMNPIGNFSFIELEPIGKAMLFMIGFSMIGLLLSNTYYFACSLAVKPSDSKVPITEYFRTLIPFVLIPCTLFLLTLLIGFPVLFLIAFLNMITPFLGLLGYVLLTVIGISILVPLFFTPQAIYYLNLNLRKAVFNSIRIVRRFYSATSFFILMEIVIAFLANRLWQSPPDSSWFLLVSIFGHSVISTALVLASFHFLNDAIKLSQSDPLIVVD